MNGAPTYPVISQHLLIFAEKRRMSSRLSALGLQSFFRTVPAYSQRFVARSVAHCATDAVLDSAEELLGAPTTAIQRRMLTASAQWPLTQAVLEAPDQFQQQIATKPLLHHHLEQVHRYPLIRLFQAPRLLCGLRDYQQQMLAGLGNDVIQQTAPWLGLAAPMQTGKSHLTPQLVDLFDSLYSNETIQFIILSSARIITAQLMEDLLGPYPETEIGRFDGLVKDAKRITVASIYSLHRPHHLRDFPQLGDRVVLVLDEASSTRAPIVRKILRHYGVATEIREGKKVRLEPKAGKNLLIGLSGTAGALEGYHVSGRLELLQAIRRGWVRDMVGERVYPTIEEQRMRSSGERMIWWRKTAENARVLADVYAERIHGKYSKNLIYVPTIEHGNLLKQQLIRRYGKKQVQFVHSNLEPEAIERALDTWEEERCILISVRMLSHGFRGRDVGAVYHTYQTNSEELFAQRTGRAWGKSEQASDPLYVLEVTWDTERFSNLARLLGLVDYPRERLMTSRRLLDAIDKLPVRRDQERKISRKIEAKEVQPWFEVVPVLLSWRETMNQLLATHGGVTELAEASGLEGHIIQAWGLGALPTQLEQVKCLASFVGGEKEAQRLWVEGWSEVVTQLEQGLRLARADFKQALWEWYQGDADVETKAEALHELLHREFHFKARTPVKIDYDRVFQTAKEVLAEAAQKGQMLSPNTVMKRVYSRYCDSLAANARPSLGTFQHIGQRRKADPRLAQLLTESEVVKKRETVEIDRARVYVLAKQVLAEFAQKGETLVPRSVMKQVYPRYCEGLEAEARPSLDTFKHLVSGRRADPRLTQLLSKSDAVEMPVYIDYDRVYKLTEEVVSAAAKRGETLTRGSVMRKVHVSYCEGLASAERPSFKRFRGMVTGGSADQRLTQVLNESGIVRKPVSIDRDRVLVLTKEVLADAAQKGETLTPSAVMNQVHARYCEDLLKAAWPHRGTFRNLVTGRGVDERIKRLFKGSAVVKNAKQVELDHDRVYTLIEQVLIEAAKKSETLELIIVMRRAHARYCEGLAPAEQPSLGTFPHLVKDRRIGQRLKNLLGNSGVIKIQQRAEIDRDRVYALAKQVLAKAEKNSETLTFIAVLRRVHARYCAGLETADRPSLKAFQNLLVGQNADKRLRRRLTESKTVKRRGHTRVDRHRIYELTEEVLSETLQEGETLTPTAVMGLVYARYCKGLTKADRPSLGTFQHMVLSRNADQRLKKMLNESGVVKKRR